MKNRLLVLVCFLVFSMVSATEVLGQTASVDTIPIKWDSLPIVNKGSFDEYFKQGNTLFALNRNDDGNPYKLYEGVYKSIDDGNSWDKILGDSVKSFVATDSIALFYTGGIEEQLWSFFRISGSYRFYEMDTNGNVKKTDDQDVFLGMGSPYLPLPDIWVEDAKLYRFFGLYNLHDENYISLSKRHEYWKNTAISSSGPSGNIAFVSEKRNARSTYLSVDKGINFDTLDFSGIPLIMNGEVFAYYRTHDVTPFSSFESTAPGIQFLDSGKFIEGNNFSYCDNGCVSLFEEVSSDEFRMKTTCDNGNTLIEEDISSALFHASEFSLQNGVAYRNGSGRLFKQDCGISNSDFEEIEIPEKGLISRIHNFQILDDEYFGLSSSKFLMRSIDQGASWNITPIKLEKDLFNTYAWHQNKLNAFTLAGRWYIWDDARWNLQNSSMIGSNQRVEFLNDNILQLQYSKSAPAQLSTDQGCTWKDIDVTAHPVDDAEPLILGDTIFFYDKSSEDSGATWHPINAAFNFSSFSSFAYNDKYLFGLTSIPANGGDMSISRSEDFGNSWSNLTYSPDLDLDPQRLVVVNDTLLAVSDNGGIWISTDDADSWTKKSNILIDTILIDSYINSIGNLIFYHTNDVSVFTPDTGENWYNLGISLRRPLIMNDTIYVIDSGTVYFTSLEDIRNELGSTVSFFDLHDDLEFTIYPNPTSSYLYVDTPFQLDYRVNVYSLESDYIGTRKILSDRVDLSGLPDGLYFLEFFTTDYRKVVKEVIIINSGER